MTESRGVAVIYVDCIHTALIPTESRKKCRPSGEGLRTGARTGERTTQGGPRSEGRSCGTGGDPVHVEERSLCDQHMSGEDWEVPAGHVCWSEPGSRDRMRAGTPPAEKRQYGGRTWSRQGETRRFIPTERS